MGYIPKDIGILPSDEVKAIKIRGQLHIVKCRAMSGYKSLCGKTASFGHTVYQSELGSITCSDCQGVRNES